MLPSRILSDTIKDAVRSRIASQATMQLAESLGSSQNRSNTFQLWHGLHKPKSALDITMSHLVAAGAQLGHSNDQSLRTAWPHIYGTRNGVSVIDVRQTIPALRRAASFIRSVVQRDGVILFVGTIPGSDNAAKRASDLLKENGYAVTSWSPGTISNAYEVIAAPLGKARLSKITANANSSSSLLDSSNPELPAFRPDAIVFLNPVQNKDAVREATMYAIPTVAIADSNIDPRAVTYPIPANDDSPRVVELVAGVLGLAGKEGYNAKTRLVDLQSLPSN